MAVPKARDKNAFQKCHGIFCATGKFVIFVTGIFCTGKNIQFFTGMTKIVTNIIWGQNFQGYFLVSWLLYSTFFKSVRSTQKNVSEKNTAHSTKLHNTTPQQSHDTTPDQRNNKTTSTLQPRPQLTIYPFTTLHDTTHHAALPHHTSLHHTPKYTAPTIALYTNNTTLHTIPQQ